MARGESRTTANVLRAQKRKQQRRAERQAALRQEAEELGVPIHELQRRKWDEVQLIREREPTIPSFTRRERDYWGW